MYPFVATLPVSHKMWRQKGVCYAEFSPHRLAVEAEAIHRSAAAVTELPGVRAEETNRRGFSVTEVHVLDAAGENVLCKPIGDYYTLALDPLLRREDDAF